MLSPQVVICAAAFLLCKADLGIKSRGNVKRMQVADMDENVAAAAGRWNGTTTTATNFLQFMRGNYKSLPWNSGTQVNSFSWKNCGGSSDLLVINGLIVAPDPLRIPGTIVFSFDVTIRETFTSPLKLAVELKKHEGFFWLPIPCIDDMGSCTYDDVCGRLAGITCPKEFGSKIPCKCPFTKGSYSLPSSSFSLQANVPSGKYYVQANLSSGSVAVNCIQIYFNIA